MSALATSSVQTTNPNSSPSFVDSSTPIELLNTNLYVRNIPLEWGDDELLGLFSQYGNVTSFKLMRDENGISRGIGFVRYRQHSDAKIAIETLDNFVIEPKLKPLSVKFSKDTRLVRLKLNCSEF